MNKPLEYIIHTFIVKLREENNPSGDVIFSLSDFRRNGYEQKCTQIISKLFYYDKGTDSIIDLDYYCI